MIRSIVKRKARDTLVSAEFTLYIIVLFKIFNNLKINIVVLITSVLKLTIDL